MTTHAVAAKPAGNRFTRFFTGIWAETEKGSLAFQKRSHLPDHAGT